MTSLSKAARVAGLLYILSSLIGALRLIYIPKALIVPGNSAATASNLASNEPLFRLGIISLLLGSVLWLLVPIALYRLLNEVDQTLAVLMVILGSLMQVPLFFVGAVTDSAALLFAGGAAFVAVFTREQQDAFVMLFLNLHHQLDLANAIFWGLWLIPFGLLVYRSRFLPRFLGVWLMMGCFGWLAFSLTGFLLPEYENQVYTLIQVFTLSEVATMLWLTIVAARERSQTVVARSRVGA
jgi:hypothetical protein